MICAQCNQPFEAERDDAVTCSNKCRQARFRHRHRKPRPPAFLTGFEARVRAWLNTNPPLDDSRAALTQALLRIAQELGGR